jgi:membrane-associated phospholipid phosphatase
MRVGARLYTCDERELALVCWCMIGAVGILLGLAVSQFGFALEWRSVAHTAGACMLLGALVRFYRRHRPNERIAVSLGCVIQLVVFTAVAAPLSYIVASFGGPLWDETLHAWDRALGLDWRAYLAFVNDQPWLGLGLKLAYMSIGPQIVIVIVALGFTGHLVQCRAFVAAFMIAALISIALSGAMPAAAMFVHLGLQPYDYPNLEPTAAFVHVAHLNALRDGTMRLLTLHDSEGIITFPSYHAALGVIFAKALWTLPSLRWPGLALNILLIAGTPIDGGHYFVDVLAGIGIAVLSLAAVHALDLPRARGTRRLLGSVTQAFPASGQSLSGATRARS